MNKPILSKIQVLDGIPLTQASINGKIETFIIDSGAPCIILNAKYVEKGENAKEFMGVSGKGTQSNMAIDLFEWQGLQLASFNAPVIDLSHLEEELGKAFYGLIGCKELSNFSFCIDYQEESIELWRALNVENLQIEAEIPFTMLQHIPILEVELDKEKLIVGLDTGAAMNLLDKNKQSDSIDSLEEDTLMGADKSVQVVKKGVNEEMLINGMSFKDMKVVWSNIDHIKQGLGQIDGLLGYEFLKQKRMLVSYDLKKIFILK